MEKIVVPNREQSNTTVIVDASCVVKIFRKLNEGIHPEIEIGRFLIEHTGYRNVPDLLGSIELVEGEQRSALAVAHRFVENQGDAWTVTGAYLGRFIDDQRVLSARPRPKKARSLRPICSRCGRSRAGPASCRARWRAGPTLRSSRPSRSAPRTSRPGRNVLSSAAATRSTSWPKSATDLDEADQALADRLLASRAAITDHIRRSLPPTINAVKVRHHGDFHLGQVLIAKDDAFILDFEGEPGRSLAERRLKAPAARDVAGLLRSIDYSTTAALFDATSLTPEERHILHPKLEIWRKKAMEEFWNAYRQAADPALWPSDPAQAQNLLDFFLLEKAFYEIEYELMNRPAWLHVPLDGTWRILKRHNVVQS